MGQNHATIRQFASNLDPGGVFGRHGEGISSRQIRFTASRTPVSGRTVMDMVGIGMEFGPRSKRKRARRVASALTQS